MCDGRCTELEHGKRQFDLIDPRNSAASFEDAEDLSKVCPQTAHSGTETVEGGRVS